MEVVQSGYLAFIWEYSKTGFRPTGFSPVSGPKGMHNTQYSFRNTVKRTSDLVLVPGRGRICLHIMCNPLPKQLVTLTSY